MDLAPFPPFHSNLTPNGLISTIGSIYGLCAAAIVIYNMAVSKLHIGFIIPVSILTALLSYFVNGFLSCYTYMWLYVFSTFKYGFGFMIMASIGGVIAIGLWIWYFGYLIYKEYTKTSDSELRFLTSVFFLDYPLIVFLFTWVPGLLGMLIQIICFNNIITIIVVSAVVIAVTIYTLIRWRNPTEYSEV
jgi:hypothetical protein